jgi:hypothetical protein
MTGAGRSFWLGLHVLDRQLVDRDGRMVAKVDDVEISEPDRPGELPIVTALLCGPSALGRRFGPRLGSTLEALRGITCEVPPSGPPALSTDLVVEIGPALKLGTTRDTLPVAVVEAFLAEHVVAHIPGSGEPGDEESGGNESQ